MPIVRENTAMRSILVLALTAGTAQNADKHWTVFADIKPPHIQLQFDVGDSKSIDLTAPMEDFPESQTKLQNLLHYVVQLNWGSTETGMLMLVIDVFALDKEHRDRAVNDYIAKHLPDFDGSRVQRTGGPPVFIPKSGWVDFRQIVIQPNEVEDLWKFASRIKRY
jgi:hypothetical protein